jgi:hypothetical protein
MVAVSSPSFSCLTQCRQYGCTKNGDFDQPNLVGALINLAGYGGATSNFGTQCDLTRNGLAATSGNTFQILARGATTKRLPLFQR